MNVHIADVDFLVTKKYTLDGFDIVKDTTEKKKQNYPSRKYFWQINNKYLHSKSPTVVIFFFFRLAQTR